MRHRCCTNGGSSTTCCPKRSCWRVPANSPPNSRRAPLLPPGSLVPIGMAQKIIHCDVVVGGETRLKRRCADTGNLLLDHHSIPVVLLLRTAESLGRCQSQESRFACGPPGLAIDHAVGVPLRHLRHHVVVHKFTHRRTKDFVVLFEQVAVHDNLRTANNNLAAVDYGLQAGVAKRSRAVRPSARPALAVAARCAGQDRHVKRFFGAFTRGRRRWAGLPGANQLTFFD